MPPDTAPWTIVSNPRTGHAWWAIRLPCGHGYLIPRYATPTPPESWEIACWCCKAVEIVAVPPEAFY